MNALFKTLFITIACANWLRSWSRSTLQLPLSWYRRFQITLECTCSLQLLRSFMSYSCTQNKRVAPPFWIAVSNYLIQPSHSLNCMESYFNTTVYFEDDSNNSVFLLLKRKPIIIHTNVLLYVKKETLHFGIYKLYKFYPKPLT